MASESISSAKNNLSALIKQVQGGDPILITDRGVPVARLESVQLGAGVPARVVALAQVGLVRLPLHEPDVAWLDLPLPAVAAGTTASDVLIAERRQGR